MEPTSRHSPTTCRMHNLSVSSTDRQPMERGVTLNADGSTTFGFQYPQRIVNQWNCFMPDSSRIGMPLSVSSTDRQPMEPKGEHRKIDIVCWSFSILNGSSTNGTPGDPAVFADWANFQYPQRIVNQWNHIRRAAVRRAHILSVSSTDRQPMERIYILP